MKPLYIWAGGKNKMIKHYKADLERLTNVDTMVEPFFGGGALTIYMYENFPNIKKFIINDIKPEIINIYRSIKEDVDTFIGEVKKYEKVYLPKDKEGRSEYYYELRHKHAYNYKDMTTLEESALLYFLMRTCFNGIWQINKNTNGRFGTPAGLLNQKDEVFSESNVREWHRFLQKVKLYSKDWKEVSEKFKNDNTFFFFDPPYRDSFTQYGGEFTDDDQKEIIQFCNNLPDESVGFLTNRDEGDGFFDLHVDSDKLEIKRFPVTYTAGRRKKTNEGFEAKTATEVLIMTKNY